MKYVNILCMYMKAPVCKYNVYIHGPPVGKLMFIGSCTDCVCTHTYLATSVYTHIPCDESKVCPKKNKQKLKKKKPETLRRDAKISKVYALHSELQ
jgi:hypothetical protein